MANGHGGRRERTPWTEEQKAAARARAAARKRGEPAAPPPGPDQFARTVDGKVAPEGATLPPKGPAWSYEAIADIVRASEAHARKRERTPDWCPYRIAEHPRMALPPKQQQMAADTALCTNNAWAANEWLAGGLLSNAASEGLLFLGYPYLAELAQRPEYRTFAETLSTEMTRKWIRFSSASDKEDKAAKIKELVDFLDHLKVREHFKQAVALDDFFGRSHLYLDFGRPLDRGNDAELATPVGNGRDATTTAKVDKKNGLKGLQVIEPVWTYPMLYNALNPLRHDWYNPQQWYVMGQKVDASRLLSFIGHPVPDLLKPAYSFGGISLSQMAKPYVDIWLETRESVGQIIHAFSVMVLSTDMSTMMQVNSSASNILGRLAVFNALRDNQGVFAINKATEDFKNVAAPLGGLHELQSQSQEHMMSVARIPAVKFTGISPQGMNASSEGEIRVFYDTISAMQEYRMRPNLTKVIDFAMISLWGARDPDITFTFVPLWALSEKEEAEVRKTEAETDDILMNGCNAITNAEVRKRVAADPDTPYAGLDVDDVPEMPAEGEGEPGEEGGGEGEGGSETAVNTSGKEKFRGGSAQEGGAEPKERGGEDSRVVPFLQGAAGSAADSICDLEQLAGDAEFNESDHPRGQPGNAGQFGSGGGGGATSSAAGGGEKSLKTKAAIDPSELTKVGKQMGSNPGGVYEDKSGTRFYIKTGKSPEHVRNELMAASLYRLAGAPTLKYRPVAGGNHIATQMEKLDKDNASKLGPEEIRRAQKDFAAHAWLANWDAVGLGGDNLGTVKGKPTPLDLGGALAYRAQGAPKGGAFGNTAGELDTLRNPKMNPDSARVFASMTPAQLRESIHRVTDISDDEIREAVAAHKGSDAMAARLIARRDDLAKRAATLGSEGDPAKATSSVVFNAGDALPVKELNGVAFAPWEPPADWADVDGQLDLDEPPIDLPKGKEASSGLLIREPDGRIWLARPRAGYGGYQHTFPKGHVERGLSPQANAIKEAYEETGLKARITGLAGDFEGDTTVTRFYMAEREGGDPAQHEDETDGVVLAPPAKLGDFLNRTRDRMIAKAHLAGDTSFEESEHPRASGGENAGQFVKKGGEGGSGGGSAEKDKPAAPTAAAPKYFYQQFTPSKSKEHHAEQAKTAMAAKVQTHSNYRKVFTNLIAEGKKFGAPGDVIKALQGRIVESLNKVMENLQKKGEADEAKKVAQKIVSLVSPTGAEPPAAVMATAMGKTAPVESQLTKENSEFAQKLMKQAAASKEAIATSIMQAAAVPATPQELEKAKKTVVLQLQFVPGAPQGSPEAQKLVDKFNAQYADKPMNSEADLKGKVAAFKALQAAMVPLMSAEQKGAAEKQKQLQAEAAKKAAQQKIEQEKLAAEVAAKNAAVMKDLGITAQEAVGFGALVAMMGGDQKSVVDAFKHHEAEAKNLGYPISGFQAALIKNYSNGGYQHINKSLRKGTWSKADHVYVKMVNKALAQMPTHKGVVNRGTSLDQNDQAKYVAGNIVEERAFTSASTGKGFGGNTEFKITSIGKRGASIKKLSQHSGESEVLFQARTFFHVTKVEGTPGGQMTIHMEEMDDEDR